MILAKSAFAKHIGRSAAWVTKLKNEGRLVLEGGKVNVEESLARMAATAGNRDDVAGRHARNRSGEGAGAPSAPVESKAFATSRKESAQADIAEMERDALRGRLVPRDDVESALKFVGAAFATLLRPVEGSSSSSPWWCPAPCSPMRRPGAPSSSSTRKDEEMASASTGVGRGRVDVGMSSSSPAAATVTGREGASVEGRIAS